MKILAIFLILMAISSYSFNKKSLKAKTLNNEKNTKSNVKVTTATETKSTNKQINILHTTAVRI